MGKDFMTDFYEKAFDIDIDCKGFNDIVRGLVVELYDADGNMNTYLVDNDNFGTDEEGMCFNDGRRKAGLPPMQVVFWGIEEAIENDRKFIDADNNIRSFRELFQSPGEKTTLTD